MIYPDYVMARVAVIDICERRYWTAHERMSDEEWRKMLQDKKNAVNDLHAYGIPDAEIREIWLTFFKPIYNGCE